MASGGLLLWYWAFRCECFFSYERGRYIRHVLYQGTLKQESLPKFAYQTHVTDISIGRTRYNKDLVEMSISLSSPALPWNRRTLKVA